MIFFRTQRFAAVLHNFAHSSNDEHAPTCCRRYMKIDHCG